MAFYAVYKQQDGTIIQTIECPSFLVNLIFVEKEYGVIEIDRVADDRNELIKNGKLVKKETNVSP